METGKTIEDTVAGTVVRSTLITSSSPSPSPVRLSPVCSIEPSGQLVLLKNTKYSSATILWFSPSPSALASRSKSEPVVDRTSQPRPGRHRLQAWSRLGQRNVAAFGEADAHRLV